MVRSERLSALSPKSMIPGKETPSRPFLGLSEEDEKEVFKIVKDYILDV
ncbi:hypothetical protein [Shewanella chilikensis]|uniref:Phage virion morphogenesis protein n=1 Tax=Shewanella chilikensis TaxID=558541 RepID=A0A6G7LUN0_9GAMM|nr:hypothetical protein [Shewanella chilikensis]QIJ05526.1 hypothetical protein GII14_16175 [Shewanella chilikensis]